MIAPQGVASFCASLVRSNQRKDSVGIIICQPSALFRHPAPR